MLPLQVTTKQSWWDCHRHGHCAGDFSTGLVLIKTLRGKVYSEGSCDDTPLRKYEVRRAFGVVETPDSSFRQLGYKPQLGAQVAEAKSSVTGSHLGRCNASTLRQE